MTIAFVTNFYNHHQKFVADEMFKQTNGQYYFISTQPISLERLNMGWGREEIPDYVKYTFTNETDKAECQKIIDEADVVILGSAPKELLITRLKKNKLTFRYAERPYKIKPPFYKYPIHFIKNLRNIIRYPNYYLLCASAYTAADYAKVLTFVNKTYQWGYFPELREYANLNALLDQKCPNSILWAGRFINLKHPEIPIEIAQKLREDGYQFKLNMIGDGPLKPVIQTIIEHENLADHVSLLGSMTPEEVRAHMEKSQLFLFTSDRCEGWGAVLNESMNSACAVVANRAIGSVPFLIRDGENGLTYTTKDIDRLYENVKKLLDNQLLREKIAYNAYQTIATMWNAENATKRFLALCERLLKGEKKIFPYSDGVCSKTEIIKE